MARLTACKLAEVARILPQLKIHLARMLDEKKTAAPVTNAPADEWEPYTVSPRRGVPPRPLFGPTGKLVANADSWRVHKDADWGPVQ